MLERVSARSRCRPWTAATRRCCTSKSRPRSAARSATVRPAPATGSPKHATVLGVNRNTVLRALRLLRDEGLLEMGRGRAITVTGTAQHGAVIARTKELLEFARRNGYPRDELIALLHRLG
jgi:hypothetical protein